MNFSSLRKVFQVVRAGRQDRPPRKRAGRGRSLLVEELEQRNLPSIIAPIIPVSSLGLSSTTTGGVSQPYISYDGRYIVYTSTAPNLVVNQVNEAPAANIYYYDTVAQTTKLVSHVPNQPTKAANGASAFATISGNDQYIVYSSDATDLVPGQSGVQGLSNVYLYNLSTGTNTLISQAAGLPVASGNDDSYTAGTTGFGLNDNSGSYLLFVSAATNLLPVQITGGRLNVFVYDTVLQTTSLVSHTPGALGTGGNDDSPIADISQDGSTIVYISLATNLVSSQSGTPGNVFLYDNRQLVGGSANPNYAVNTLVSGSYDSFLNRASPTVGAGYASEVALSADGTLVTYVSQATNLVPSQITDFNPATEGYPPSPNLFAVLPSVAQTYLLSGAETASGPSHFITSNGGIPRLAVDGNGSSVAFISNASDLYPTQSGLPGAGRNSGNVFVANFTPGNLANEGLRLASYDFNTPASAQNLTSPAGGVVIRNSDNYSDLSISNDGRFITYQQQQIAGVTGSLVQNQNGPNFVWNAFVFDQASDAPYGTNALLSRTSSSQSTTGNFDTTGSRINGTGTSITFVSDATNLTASTLGQPRVGGNLFVFVAFASGPPALSTAAAEQVNAQTLVYGTSMDGRFVVFTSNSPTVVPGQVDNNGDQDVFVYDRTTNTTHLVSHTSTSLLTTADAGSPNTGDGTQPPGAPVVISQDGNWIAFVSDATDLVAGQAGQPQTPNIYLFDNRPGATFGTVTLVSHVGYSATITDSAPSFNPVIDADGRYIAFVSYSKLLVPNLTGQPGDFFKSNVFLFDRLNPNSMVLLSDFGNTPVTGNGNSLHPSISDDGRYIAFQSYATDLLTSGTVAPASNIYLVDQVAQTTTLVSHTVTSFTNSANGSSIDPVVSPDGSSVAYVSFATDIISGQRVTVFSNVFVYHRASQINALVSGIDGSPTVSASGFSDSPVLNTSGTEVAFRSSAPDLLTGMVNTAGNNSNIFLFTAPVSVVLVSHQSGALSTTALGNSEAPAIDGAGAVVAYLSLATNLLPGQVEPVAVNNVFVYSVSYRLNALGSQNGSPVTASPTPTFRALLSRDLVLYFDALSGATGTSVATSDSLVTVQLLPDTVPAGTGAGATVGTLKIIDSLIFGVYYPVTQYVLGGDADSAEFTLVPNADGSQTVKTAAAVTKSAQQVYQMSFLINFGFGYESGVLNIAVSPPASPPPSSLNYVATGGNGTVAADLPGLGVWRFETAIGWQQLTTTSATQVGVDSNNNVVALLGGAVWRWEDSTSWRLLTASPTLQVGIAGNGIVTAMLGIGGVWRYEDAGGWRELSVATPTQVAVDANGDVAALLGGGVWRYEDATGWRLLTASNTLQLGIAGNGIVTARLGIGGVWRYEDTGGWRELTTATPTQVGVDPSGDVVAILSGAVWRYEDAIGWQLLTAANALQVGIGGNGTVVAELQGAGVWRYQNGWQLLTGTNAG